MIKDNNMDWSPVKNQCETEQVINILYDSFPVKRELIKEYIEEVSQTHYYNVCALRVDNKVVATATFALDRRKVGDLKLLAVHKDHRKKGYARYMVDKILADLKSRGCRRVYIAATDEVVEMWEKFGFEYTDTFYCKAFGAEDIFHAYVIQWLD